jgi:hypothetical protein
VGEVFKNWLNEADFMHYRIEGKDNLIANYTLSNAVSVLESVILDKESESIDTNDIMYYAICCLLLCIPFLESIPSSVIEEFFVDVLLPTSSGTEKRDNKSEIMKRIDRIFADIWLSNNNSLPIILNTLV